MKNLKLFLVAIVMIASYTLSAQVAITTDGSDPDGSAMLDVQSTTKGFLPPRMSKAQMLAISSPANALMVVNTDPSVDSVYIYISSINAWKALNYGVGTITPSVKSTKKITPGDAIIDDRDSKSSTPPPLK